MAARALPSSSGSATTSAAPPARLRPTVSIAASIRRERSDTVSIATSGGSDAAGEGLPP